MPRLQIVVSLVNGRPGAMNFSYSPLLRDFTKATNIRLRFLRTNTLLGHLMGKALRDPTVTRRVRPWASLRAEGRAAGGASQFLGEALGERGRGFTGGESPAGECDTLTLNGLPLQYYYSIKDISIGGRCVCHGHADVCDAKDPSDPFR